MVDDMVTDMKMDMVADMKVDMVAGMVPDMKVDKVFLNDFFWISWGNFLESHGLSTRSS